MEFIKISNEKDLSEVRSVLNRAHSTVAKEYGFTRESNPSNGAFIDTETLKGQLENGIELFGLKANDRIVGCIAIEKSKREINTFYIEKVSVLPELRERGYGVMLMDFALEKIYQAGGTVASIALIDSNKPLKKWYLKQGFKETGTKDFEHLPFRVCFMQKQVSSNNRAERTIDTYNKFAESYQKKFMQFDLYDKTYDIFCDLVDKQNAAVFEIGCGPGNVTRFLLNRRPDFNITAIDLAPNMVELAKTNNPEANFVVMDCREIDRIEEKFDAIMCAFCMPYLSKEECCKLIEGSAKLLNEGGVVYLSTMEGDYSKSGYEPTSFSGNSEVYIYYHQREIIKKYLADNSFDIICEENIEYPEEDGSFLTDMIFIAKKAK